MDYIEKQNLLLSVGERIRRIRILKQLPMKEIAAHLEITTQAYGNMERGKADIPISRLFLLARLLEEPLLQIISEENYTAIIRFEKNESISLTEAKELRFK